jgi:hypothetical protein
MMRQQKNRKYKFIWKILEIGLRICRCVGQYHIHWKRRNIYNEKNLRRKGLSDRQIKAVLFVKKNGKITNKEYQKICDIKKSIAAEELKDLTNRAVLLKVGLTGRATKYILQINPVNVRKRPVNVR